MKTKFLSEMLLMKSLARRARRRVMSYRRKWDIKKSNDNWMQQDKLVYNGAVTSMDINSFTNQTNLNWGIGGKLSAIIGVDGEVKLNVDMNKFTSTLEEMSKIVKP